MQVTNLADLASCNSGGFARWIFSVVLAFFGASELTSTARAETVTFVFDGVVSSVEGTDRMCSHTQMGDPVTATLSYDRDQVGFDAGGDGWGYDAHSIFTIDGEEVADIATTAWIRNDDGAGDIFAALLWRDELHPLNRATLQLFNFNQTVFADNSLPSTLDLADFDYFHTFSYALWQGVDERCSVDAEVIAISGGIVDTDGDGIADDDDNCPGNVNPNQGDADGDGIGDACEADSDADGIVDDGDNCPANANPDQADNDSDALGDLCDADDDNDGVADLTDGCVTVYDPDQLDTDGDGHGDACDGDDDADGVADGQDSCAGTSTGLPVGIDGCSGQQFVEKRCPKSGAWENRGQYVSCVSGVSSEARGAGLLTASERAAIVRTAARGD